VREEIEGWRMYGRNGISEESMPDCDALLVLTAAPHLGAEGGF
jgi:hypothetical protein